MKTKFTLLTFVRSEEDDSLGLVPLNISLFVHLLWGLPKRFLLLRRTLVSNWHLRSNIKVQVFAPTIAPQNFNFSLLSEEKKYNFDL